MASEQRPAEVKADGGGQDDPAWAKKSLRKRCECEMCRSGQATSHNDDSHDQSMDQTIRTAGVNLRIIGGTTKCARVMIRFFERLYANGALRGKSAIEVGSGTGLVGMSLALLGARAQLTDQSYVMDVLEHNLANARAAAKAAGRDFDVDTKEFVWSSDVKTLRTPAHVVVGSDLIYAREGIKPLTDALKAIVGKSVTELGAAAGDAKAASGGKAPSGGKVADVDCFVAVIRRFKWEEEFFERMDEAFEASKAYEEGDICIYRYRWKGSKASTPKSAAQTKPAAQAKPKAQEDPKPATGSGQVGSVNTAKES